MFVTQTEFYAGGINIVNRFAGKIVNEILIEGPVLYYVGTIETTPPTYDPISY